LIAKRKKHRSTALGFREENPHESVVAPYNANFNYKEIITSFKNEFINSYSLSFSSPFKILSTAIE